MDQLVRYAAALENPPLQVVCDTDRFIIRTAWTNTVPKQYEIELDELALPEKREILWAVFHDPERLRPKETRAGLTKEAADKFSTIALRLQGRGTPEEVAHFVNQLVFCFFANSVKLLPEGFFSKLLKRAGQRPDKAQDYFNSLFEAIELAANSTSPTLRISTAAFLTVGAPSGLTTVTSGYWLRLGASIGA